ncbi:MAG TPA: 50S ribosomal protein L17 [Candidatus Saccharimonadales bacterium]|nr:50S ribosomal protein L17 [Candidatus Saccharimonadales bacterium]
MHRHGYQGRKFGRQRDQRQALIKGLAESLVIRESIETTLPKAKELIGYTEKLITKAKQNSLHSRRQVISGLSTTEVAHKLVDDIVPKLAGRTSGHLKIEKTSLRRGDSTQMARVSFVDDLSKPIKKPSAETKPAAKSPAKPKSRPARTRAAGKEAK